MKVQCDVCAAEAASVICCADEAALCDGCDHRVHRANKVAGKHHRFSLLHPANSSAQSPPLCDICQEKRGFLFCTEDRAILCRDCDAAVHGASDLAKRHNRFLLTGVRISAAAAVVPPPEEEAVAECKVGGVYGVNGMADSSGSTATLVSNGNGHAYSSCCSSSISEYLINMLPGWHVEDFLTDDTCHTSTNDVSTAGSSFCKVDDAAQFMGTNQGRGGTERNCWVARGGGVGLREVKRGRGKQQRQSEVSIMAVPRPGGDRVWDDGNKRSRISVRYL